MTGFLLGWCLKWLWNDDHCWVGLLRWLFWWWFPNDHKTNMGLLGWLDWDKWNHETMIIDSLPGWFAEELSDDQRMIKWLLWGSCLGWFFFKKKSSVVMAFLLALLRWWLEWVYHDKRIIIGMRIGMIHRMILGLLLGWLLEWFGGEGYNDCRIIMKWALGWWLGWCVKCLFRIIVGCW